jgi:hypothetical protein
LDGVVVIGAGGHAKVLISTLTACGVSVAAVVDDDTKWGMDAQGTRVSRLERELGDRGVVGVGDKAQRRDVARALSFEWETVVHPSAYVHPSAKLGRAPGAHLAGSVQVGEGAFLGIGSVVCPGVKIGRWATLGAGGVAIRDLADGVVAFGVPARALEVDRRS